MNCKMHIVLCIVHALHQRTKRDVDMSIELIEAERYGNLDSIQCLISECSNDTAR